LGQETGFERGKAVGEKCGSVENITNEGGFHSRCREKGVKLRVEGKKWEKPRGGREGRLNRGFAVGKNIIGIASTEQRDESQNSLKAADK